MEYIGASVTAISLLFGWIFGLTTIITAVWLVLRATGHVHNRRMAIIAIVPFLAASFKTLKILSGPFLVILAIWVAPAASRGVTLQLPLPGTTAHFYGEIVFCIGFAAFAAGYLPLAYGISILGKLKVAMLNDRVGIEAVRWFGGIFIGNLIWYYRGPYCALAVVLILIYALSITRLALGAVAWKRFADAPMVVPSTARTNGDLLFVHISDVHVTSQKNGLPTGGGHSGLADLHRLAGAIVDRKIEVPFVVVSGDLVDRGDTDEWEKAMVPLRAIRSAGVGVILAPGNHDLLPSYSPFGLFWTAVRPGALRPTINGAQLTRFLDAASELEPRITTWNDVPLHDYLARIGGSWGTLIRVWDDARVEAAAALGLPPNTRHAVALSRYRRANPAAGAALDARIAAQAKTSFPSLNEGVWHENFHLYSPDDVALQLKDDRWLERWYEAYPLKFEIGLPDETIDIVIANSTPGEPLLAQSSIGSCGDAQINRLDQILAQSTTQTILVVHHHPFAAWQGDHYRFERWGTLAHDATEGTRLFDLLRSHARPEREIFLLMGHTHEASRAGFVPVEKGAAHGFWYFESAAFGDPNGREMLAAAYDGIGLRVTMIPRP